MPARFTKLDTAAFHSVCHLTTVHLPDGPCTNHFTPLYSNTPFYLILLGSAASQVALSPRVEGPATLLRSDIVPLGGASLKR